jgi:predicted GIY-YIG superfamily endonuclease
MSSTLQPSVHPTALDVRTHYLYRIFDAAGALLYVGITHDLGMRFDQHRRDKPWWHQKHRHTVEEAPSRADVMFREARAILTEHPRHNKDIPTLARFDELRGRIIADEEGLTETERIGILEHQLRQAQRRARSAETALTRVQAASDRAREAEVASARQAAAAWKDRAEKAEAQETEAHRRWKENSESLHELIDYWRERAEGIVLPRTFIVEGPRMADGSMPRMPVARACRRPHADQAPAVPSAAPVPALPRRSLFGRLFGS